MDNWRSINYERDYRRELERLKKNNLSKKNKELIIRYKNHRLANSVSLARVTREMKSLRLLYSKYGIELNNITEERLEEVFAELELENLKLNTINEYKKAIKYFLRFTGNHELAAKIKRKEPKDNELTRDDLLSIDEVLKLVSVAMNEKDSALIMCHLGRSMFPFG